MTVRTCSFDAQYERHRVDDVHVDAARSGRRGFIEQCDAIASDLVTSPAAR